MKSAKHRIFHHLFNFAKGAVIGATMSVPGISGGTMAILLRIYDELVSAVGSFFKNARQNFLFLFTVALGGLLGVWLLSRPLLSLLDLYPQPMTYFFLGVVAGSIPMLMKKARVTRIKSPVILFPLIGAAITVGLYFVPTGLINLSVSGWQAYLLLGAVGFFTAASFVLPGISFTYVLLVLGLYETCMQAIHDFNWNILLPMGIGLVLGTIVIAKLLETCMTKHPQGTYLIITGFVVSSIIMQLFDRNVGWPQGGMIPICVMTFLLGALFVLAISRDYKRKR